MLKNLQHFSFCSHRERPQALVCNLSEAGVDHLDGSWGVVDDTHEETKIHIEAGYCVVNTLLFDGY